LHQHRIEFENLNFDLSLGYVNMMTHQHNIEALQWK